MEQVVTRVANKSLRDAVPNLADPMVERMKGRNTGILGGSNVERESTVAIDEDSITDSTEPTI